MIKIRGLLALDNLFQTIEGYQRIIQSIISICQCILRKNNLWRQQLHIADKGNWGCDLHTGDTLDLCQLLEANPSIVAFKKITGQKVMRTANPGLLRQDHEVIR